MNNLKLYIARDEGKWDEDVQKAGELNLFYDTPELLFDIDKRISYWGLILYSATVQESLT